MVESINKNEAYKNAMKRFTVGMESEFFKLKSDLPEEQLKLAELRIPEMLTLKAEFLELIE